MEGKQLMNKQCKFYSEIDGEPKCEIKMDMFYCGRNCAYATTNTEKVRSTPYKATTQIFGITKQKKVN